MIVRDGPKRPRYPLALIHPLGPLFRHLPLSLRRHLLYARVFRRWGNFRRPKLMNEKSQWRIINDRRPIVAFSQDKLAGKEYVQRVIVANGIGDTLKIPATLWVGTDVRELKLLAGQLPQRWVLKPNHSSGRFRILDIGSQPGQQLDWDDLIAAGDRWMKRDEEELVFGHWAYGQARHLLIAEERIGDGINPPIDLKVHAHNGRTSFYFWVDHARPSAKYACFLPDGTWFRWLSANNPLSEDPGDFPILTETERTQMLQLTRLIGEPFDKIRVDVYFDNGTFWFGELTQYENSGLYPASAENDAANGAIWQLPDLTAPDPREAEWRALLQGMPKGTLQE